MKLHHLALVLSLAAAAAAQQPRGVREALDNMASQPATHTAFTFDRDMLQTYQGLFQDHPAALNSVTVENFKFHENAFYIPESMQTLVHAYNAAGWKHLVNENVSSPRESASPTHPLTDMWLHFRGAEIDDVTVLVRGPRNMSLIEVSCTLRPLDLVHLSGHFGIPKVDPDAVMVPAPPGK